MNNTRKHEGSLNIVGSKIKYYRELKKISYQKLSNMLMLYGIDIHKQAIYNIEIGIRTVVDYELCAFAKCFNVTVNELVGDFFETLE